LHSPDVVLVLGKVQLPGLQSSVRCFLVCLFCSLPSSTCLCVNVVRTPTVRDSVLACLQWPHPSACESWMLGSSLLPLLLLGGGGSLSSSCYPDSPVNRLHLGVAAPDGLCCLHVPTASGQVRSCCALCGLQVRVMRSRHLHRRQYSVLVWMTICAIQHLDFIVVTGIVVVFQVSVCRDCIKCFAGCGTNQEYTTVVAVRSKREHACL
jgi:hypothetical protein